MMNFCNVIVVSNTCLALVGYFLLFLASCRIYVGQFSVIDG